MEMGKNTYTLVIFSENKMGLMARIVGLITRRHVNIESINSSPSSIEGIHRYTIVVELEEDNARKLVAQINKQVDVLKAFYYTNEDVVYQEIALYKIPSEVFYDGDTCEKLVRMHNARILSIESEYIRYRKNRTLRRNRSATQPTQGKRHIRICTVGKSSNRKTNGAIK